MGNTFVGRWLYPPDQSKPAERLTGRIFGKNTYPTVGQLVDDGLPRINFIRTATGSTQYISSHMAIENEIKNQPISSLRVEDSHMWLGVDSLDRQSRFLGDLLESKEVTGRIEISFSNESMIQVHFHQLLRDLASAAGLGGKIRIEGECSIINELRSKHRTSNLDDGGSKQHNIADFWVVTLDGRPIFIIEMKSPDAPQPDGVPILDNPLVVGQITDYMVDCANSFGLDHVFGATSTLKETKFFWFPHSSEVAAADTLPTAGGYYPSPGTAAPSRDTICSSRVYDHTDKALLPTLIAVLQKARRCGSRPVAFLSAERQYITLRDSGWYWRKLDPDYLQNLEANINLCVNQDTRRCKIFGVVKYFQRGPQFKVWLTLAGEAGTTLVVAKQVKSTDEAERECATWNALCSPAVAFTAKLCQLPAVIMPLVFTATAPTAGQPACFLFNLQTLWAPHATAADGQASAVTGIPSQLERLTAQIEVLARAYTPQTAALQAVEDLAKLKLCHSDIEWRHIGLLPVFSDSKSLIGLRPVLIDFGRMEVADSVGNARAKMIAALERLLGWEG